MAKDRVDRDDEDLVRLYLSDIGQYTLLTKDDEVRLAQTIEEGRESQGRARRVGDRQEDQAHAEQEAGPEAFRTPG